MCVYSYIGDRHYDKWTKPNKPWPPSPYDDLPWIPQPESIPPIPPYSPYPSKEDVEIFKEAVKELEKLLEYAKVYDKENGEPDCELEDKKKLLQEIADRFGVEINFP